MQTPLGYPSAGLSPVVCRRLLCAAASACLYGILLSFAPYPGQAAVKASMCVLLILTAARHTPADEQRWLCCALSAAAAGDILLELTQFSFSFVGGLGAFLLAHLAYCALLLRWRGAPHGWRKAAVILLWIAAPLLYAAFFPRLRSLAAPVALYMLALCSMASLALSVRTPGKLIATGSLLFVASDAILGIERFLIGFPGSNYLIWSTYALAQLAMTAGILRDSQTIRSRKLAKMIAPTFDAS